MVYRFSWKALLWFLCMFSFGNSRALAQNSVYMSLYQQEGMKQWGLDLAKLNPGESIYLLVSDTSELDSWQELNGKTLGALFDYAMPRFTLDYDSFDCLERTLIIAVDSTQDLVRGPGEILGIPGSPVKRPAVVRGQTNDLTIRYLSGQELFAFSEWIRGGQFVIEVRLNDEVKKEKRVLLFTHDDLSVPQCFYRTSGAIIPLSVHLFSMDREERILPATWNKERGTVLLPPEVMQQRRIFQDTLIQYWQEGSKSVLIYSWDIGFLGGDKCSPCVAPPPEVNLLQSLGMDSMPEHVYVSYVIFPAKSPRELVSIPFEAFQWVFEMHVPARGFLNCEEAVLYRAMVQKRQVYERENLYGLLGDKATVFIE